jgi:hypothetical protein
MQTFSLDPLVCMQPEMGMAVCAVCAKYAHIFRFSLARFFIHHPNWQQRLKKCAVYRANLFTFMIIFRFFFFLLRSYVLFQYLF